MPKHDRFGYHQSFLGAVGMENKMTFTLRVLFCDEGNTRHTRIGA